MLGVKMESLETVVLHLDKDEEIDLDDSRNFCPKTVNRIMKSLSELIFPTLSELND